MEYFAIPLAILALFVGLALLLHGFPSIKITKKYYNKDKK